MLSCGGSIFIFFIVEQKYLKNRKVDLHSNHDALCRIYELQHMLAFSCRFISVMLSILVLYYPLKDVGFCKPVISYFLKDFAQNADFLSALMF